MTTRAELLSKAQEMRQEKGHVDVVSLARDLDVEVVGVNRMLDDGYNAQISYSDGKYLLQVNGQHTLERQRFSIAHELAHLALHHAELEKYGKLSRSGSSQLEEEADELAAEVLMPEDGVREYFETFGIGANQITLQTIKSVAEVFRVSKQVAIKRLRDLGYEIPYIPLR